MFMLHAFMLSLVCSLCSVSGGWRHTCKEQKSHISPLASISAAGTICTVSQGVLGAQRTAVFALFPFLMQAYSHLYAKSILKVFRNT